MGSLRARLGLFVGAVALGLTAVAVVLLGVLRWQEEDQRVEEAVTLAAFQLAEAPTRAEPTLDLDVGIDPFAALYGNPPDRLARTGDIPPGLEQQLIDEIWQFTTDDGAGVTAEFDQPGAGTVVAAGALCADPAVCDTAIVGATRRPLAGYLSDRWYWLVLIPSVAGVAALATTRWLVGRSLRPVDAMRAELDVITATDLDRRVPVPSSGDELGRLGRSMNATIERLGAAVAANERFVADAAHELRSPITGVRAALELEASRSPDSGLLADGVRELDRAGRLVDDLLALAGRQGRPTARADVDVDDVVRDEIAKAEARFPDVRLGHQLTPVRARSNADDLRRVVANLIENACLHGGGEVDVTVERDADRAVIRIDDDGPGIPADRRQAVFERFARLDDSRSRETGGSGLGLAIVRELVADLGGTVAITDGSRGGACVSVTLPASRPEPGSI